MRSEQIAIKMVMLVGLLRLSVSIGEENIEDPMQNQESQVPQENGNHSNQEIDQMFQQVEDHQWQAYLKPHQKIQQFNQMDLNKDSVVSLYEYNFIKRNKRYIRFKIKDSNNDNFLSLYEYVGFTGGNVYYRSANKKPKKSVSRLQYDPDSDPGNYIEKYEQEMKEYIQQMESLQDTNISTIILQDVKEMKE